MHTYTKRRKAGREGEGMEERGNGGGRGREWGREKRGREERMRKNVVTHSPKSALRLLGRETHTHTRAFLLIVHANPSVHVPKSFQNQRYHRFPWWFRVRP